MNGQRSEVWSRLVRFLDQDTDGLRRFVLQSIVDARQFTARSLYEVVRARFSVSMKAVTSMVGYICSSLGILRINKQSYRTPRTYILRDEYADMARKALSMQS